MFFIKRVIGLPGETIELTGSHVTVDKPNAPPETLSEPYVQTDRLENEYGVYTLGEDEYFVMGDNRIESSDSRSWGVLPKKDIVGRALLRLLPLSQLSLLPGHASYLDP